MEEFEDANPEPERIELDKLLKERTAVAYIDKQQFPEREELDQYDIELVVDTYWNQEESQKQDYEYFQLTHKTTKKEIRIPISDARLTLDHTYEVEWRQNKKGQKESTKLVSQIGVSLSVNSSDYFPFDEEMWMEQFRDHQLEYMSKMEFQEHGHKFHSKEDARILSKLVKEKQAREKKRQFQAKMASEKPTGIQKYILEPNEEISQKMKSQLGSDIDENEEDFQNSESFMGRREEQKQKMGVYAREPRKIKHSFDSFDSLLIEEKNLTRYSETTKLIIVPRLIAFFKESSKKIQLPDVEDFFRRANYYIETKELKALLNELCLPMKPRQRGFQLKDEFLTQKQKLERQSQELDRQAQQKAPKARSKRGASKK